jgi:anaerobic dimethyl sulfoxide reductase subunit B (iron-sulfur subunit)
LHCIHPPCVEACPEKAITKRLQDGIVLVDKDKCNGCRICLEACPFGAPQFGENEIMQKCDLCVDAMNLDMESPPCAATCPTQALMFGVIDREEKSLQEQRLKKLIAI